MDQALIEGRRGGAQRQRVAPSGGKGGIEAAGLGLHRPDRENNLGHLLAGDPAMAEPTKPLDDAGIVGRARAGMGADSGQRLRDGSTDLRHRTEGQHRRDHRRDFAVAEIIEGADKPHGVEPGALASVIPAAKLVQLERKSRHFLR